MMPVGLQFCIKETEKMPAILYLNITSGQLAYIEEARHACHYVVKRPIGLLPCLKRPIGLPLCMHVKACKLL
jgi:hypothetical protein